MLARFAVVAVVCSCALGDELKKLHPHFEDPKNGCRKDEEAIQIQGVEGKMCSPKCKANACPSNVPAGVTATPQCVLRSPSGDKNCALICQKGDKCGENASCKPIQGIGICTYDDDAASITEAMTFTVADESDLVV